MEIVQSLLTKMGIFRKPQMKALTTLFATILIACGKVNFTNLSRYSERTSVNCAETRIYDICSKVNRKRGELNANMMAKLI